MAFLNRLSDATRPARDRGRDDGAAVKLLDIDGKAGASEQSGVLRIEQRRYRVAW